MSDSLLSESLLSGPTPSGPRLFGPARSDSESPPRRATHVGTHVCPSQPPSLSLFTHSLAPSPLSISLHPIFIFLFVRVLPFLICLWLLQVDGPTHFVALGDGGWRSNGATVLKRWLLGLVGWRVVTVPYWEWEVCVGQAEQAKYLQRLLDL